jgi:hypothetical protein
MWPLRHVVASCADLDQAKLSLADCLLGGEAITRGKWRPAPVAREPGGNGFVDRAGALTERSRPANRTRIRHFCPLRQAGRSYRLSPCWAGTSTGSCGKTFMSWTHVPGCLLVPGRMVASSVAAAIRRDPQQGGSGWTLGRTSPEYTPWSSPGGDAPPPRDDPPGIGGFSALMRTPRSPRTESEPATISASIAHSCRYGRRSVTLSAASRSCSSSTRALLISSVPSADRTETPSGGQVQANQGAD